MAKTKIHWYWGCGWGRAYSHDFSASQFLTDASKNPDWFCVTCSTKARLALAKESAPKPPACKGERTDSDRYAELRALVEAWQSHQAGSSTALAEWRHR